MADKDCSSGVPGHPADPPPAAAPGGTRKRILIVEDEPMIRETMRFSLEQAGYECSFASDGTEALMQARARVPDLILLDIMLPKLNGYQVCRLLKQDRRFSRVPIVMVTARTQERDYVQGKECGADDYLTKPFEFSDLLQVVARRLAFSSPA